jgi:glycerophosphoryl diester phosphodiesterase
MRLTTAVAALAACLAAADPASEYAQWNCGESINVQPGPRPFYLVERIQAHSSPGCNHAPKVRSIPPTSPSPTAAAPLQFPEHTKESWRTATGVGAGIIECDVTFTKDQQLVCRHSRCDLHTTTNILTIPGLAAKCTKPFQPAAGGYLASATCCATDITLAKFKFPCGKMDASNASATDPQDFSGGLTYTPLAAH